MAKKKPKKGPGVRVQESGKDAQPASRKSAVGSRKSAGKDAQAKKKPAPKKKPSAAGSQPASQKPSAADKHRRAAARRSRKNYAADAELGALPKVKNPRRRKRAKASLWEHLKAYHTEPGEVPLSADHKKMVAFLQDCILGGGFYAQAIARGFAKTTIGVRAIVWAILNGHRRYVVLFGFDKPFAADLLVDIQTELLENDLLAEDYPELIVPIRAIGGVAQRATSQTFGGKRTHAKWKTTDLQLPTLDVPGADGAGAIVVARPRGNARGLRRRLPDGTIQRPDFFLADDIQSDDSAGSPKQVEKQLSYILKSWMLLSGHHKNGAGVVNGTIIEHGDVMARLTDPLEKRFAVWQSQRLRMVRKWADRHENLWLDKYAELRSSYPAGEPGAQAAAQDRATAYYKKNRKAMDAGCQVAWDACKSPGELSAIQHAYNLRIDLGEEAFDCECQNDPHQKSHDFTAPPPAEIARKQHGLAPCVPPTETLKISAYIDQQEKLLYWLVAAWCEGLSGFVLDYGSFPAQRRRYFSLSGAKHTLQDKYKAMSDEARLHAALTDLTATLFAREFRTPKGDKLRIDRLGVDTNYGIRTKTIRNWMEQSVHRAQLVAGYGRGIGAKTRPIAEWPKQTGEERGDEWVMRRASGTSVRTLLYNTNFHKRAVVDGLGLPMASPGSISLPRAAPEAHMMFADHVDAEFGILVTANDRTILEFEAKPGRDNHLYDCLVGSRVVASTVGVKSVGQKKQARRKSVRKTKRSRRL